MSEKMVAAIDRLLWHLFPAPLRRAIGAGIARVLAPLIRHTLGAEALATFSQALLHLDLWLRWSLGLVI